MVSGRRFRYQGCCKPVVIYVVSSIENQNRIIHRGLHLTNSCRNTLIFILLLFILAKTQKKNIWQSSINFSKTELHACDFYFPNYTCMSPFCGQD